jgi:basic membrane lipoprotein Med (substrate-binding protein (PBP1-ABC) superfamily)
MGFPHASTGCVGRAGRRVHAVRPAPTVRGGFCGYAVTGGSATNSRAKASSRGVGSDGDRSYLGNHMLASALKQLDQAVLIAIRSFVQGTRPGGRDIMPGLDDNAVGITGISPDVPTSVRQRLAREQAALRRHSRR